MNKRNFNFKKFNILSSIRFHRKESMNILQPTFKGLCQNYGSYRTQCNFRMQIQEYLQALRMDDGSIIFRVKNCELYVLMSIYYFYDTCKFDPK